MAYEAVASTGAGCGGGLMRVNEKLSSEFEGDMVLKYQVIPENLDVLVSVRTDEDISTCLMNMLAMKVKELQSFELSCSLPILSYLRTKMPLQILTQQNNITSMPSITQFVHLPILDLPLSMQIAPPLAFLLALLQKAIPLIVLF
ncbi:hypothetical protein GH714_005608 [Hevea brasiliensis]|uniref:Uncharacterized protein n=1 Tax=Hevea brasiliensis TaxID=3981 RepID=A0A6A6KY07_HEVBR|nr:hypothetical protein GH714_005608 [Hevea brasiliensis]